MASQGIHIETPEKFLNYLGKRGIQKILAANLLQTDSEMVIRSPSSGSNTDGETWYSSADFMFHREILTNKKYSGSILM